MPIGVRLKLLPEILATFYAGVRQLIDETLDAGEVAVMRAILELCALSDADQYAQIGRILDLYDIRNCKGSDLDEHMFALGAGLFEELRRLKARTSVSMIAVGNGLLLATSNFATSTAVGATSFTVATGTGAAFPSAGALYLERGTERAERVTYVRNGDVFTVVTAMVYPHNQGGEVVTIAVQSQIVGAVLAGGLSVTLYPDTAAAWPTSGSVILDRGLSSRETIPFTRAANSSVLTLTSPMGFGHANGATAILSTTGSDQAIPIWSSPYAPATDTSVQVDFKTAQAGTLLDGDLVSELIPVESVAVGAATRVGSNTITQWTSAPFPNATVTNPVSATRGAEQEEDEPYLARGLAFIAGLSKGPAPAIEEGVTGLVDEATGEELLFAQCVEPVAPGRSLLYISTGDPLYQIHRQVLIGRDVVIRDAAATDRRGKLARYGPFQVAQSPAAVRTPRLFRSLFGGSATSVGSNYLEDTALAMTVGLYGLPGHLYYLKTVDDQFIPIVTNSAIRFTLSASGTTPALGPYAIFDFIVDPLVPALNNYLYEPGTDYNFNPCTGEVEMASPLNAHDAVVAASDNAAPGIGAYSYSTGLAALAQRTVNGDPTDFTNFPGLKATGGQVLVVQPVVISPSYTIQVIPKKGFSLVQLAPDVSQVVQTYVNSLGMGEEPDDSEIARLIKNQVPGCGPTKVLTASPAVPDGSYVRINGSNVTVV